MALQQEQRHVYVQDFIKDEAKQIVGVKGQTWPDRIPVIVTLDMECEKAKNEKRKTFAQFAKGFNASGQKFKLEKGAFLRLRTLPDENGPKEEGYLTLKTDWINPVSYNREQSMDKLHFGLVLGKVRTPSDVWQKREEIRNSDEFRSWVETREQETKRKLPGREYNDEIEKRLAKAMPGKQRYYATYYQYAADKVIEGASKDELRDGLKAYFEDPAFAIQESERGRQYRAVKPHLIIRGLNENGEYNGERVEFMPSDAEILPRDEDNRVIADAKSFKTPDECVADVLNGLPHNSASWSILPAKVYTHSLIQMEMNGESKNNRAIKKVYDLNGECHVKDGNDPAAKIAMAIPMGLRMSNDGDRPCVIETVRDYQLEKVDPVLVAGVAKGTNPGEIDRYIMLPLAPKMTQSVGHDMVEIEDESDGPAPF